MHGMKGKERPQDGWKWIRTPTLKPSPWVVQHLGPIMWDLEGLEMLEWLQVRAGERTHTAVHDPKHVHALVLTARAVHFIVTTLGRVEGEAGGAISAIRGVVRGFD